MILEDDGVDFVLARDALGLPYELRCSVRDFVAVAFNLPRQTIDVTASMDVTARMGGGEACLATLDVADFEQLAADSQRLAAMALSRARIAAASRPQPDAIASEPTNASPKSNLSETADMGTARIDARSQQRPFASMAQNCSSPGILTRR